MCRALLKMYRTLLQICGALLQVWRAQRSAQCSNADRWVSVRFIECSDRMCAKEPHKLSVRLIECSDRIHSDRIHAFDEHSRLFCTHSISQWVYVSLSGLIECVLMWWVLMWYVCTHSISTDVMRMYTFDEYTHHILMWWVDWWNVYWCDEMCGVYWCDEWTDRMCAKEPHTLIERVYSAHWSNEDWSNVYWCDEWVYSAKWSNECTVHTDRMDTAQTVRMYTQWNDLVCVGLFCRCGGLFYGCVGLFCRCAGLFCGCTGFICGGMGLFCRCMGLFRGFMGLFCGCTGFDAQGSFAEV